MQFGGYIEILLFSEFFLYAWNILLKEKKNKTEVAVESEGLIPTPVGVFAVCLE